MAGKGRGRDRPPRPSRRSAICCRPYRTRQSDSTPRTTGPLASRARCPFSVRMATRSSGCDGSGCTTTKPCRSRPERPEPATPSDGGNSSIRTAVPRVERGGESVHHREGRETGAVAVDRERDEHLGEERGDGKPRDCVVVAPHDGTPVGSVGRDTRRPILSFFGTAAGDAPIGGSVTDRVVGELEVESADDRHQATAELRDLVVPYPCRPRDLDIGHHRLPRLARASAGSREAHPRRCIADRVDSDPSTATRRLQRLADGPRRQPCTDRDVSLRSAPGVDHPQDAEPHWHGRHRAGARTRAPEGAVYVGERTGQQCWQWTPCHAAQRRCPLSRRTGVRNASSPHRTSSAG